MSDLKHSSPSPATPMLPEGSSGGTSQNPATLIAATPKPGIPPTGKRGPANLGVGPFVRFNPDNRLPSTAFHGKK